MAFRWARFYWKKIFRGKRNSRIAPAQLDNSLLPIRVDIKNRIVVPCQEDFQEEYNKETKLYKTNRIRTSKYSLWSFIPRNLFEQFQRFANLYFLFIVLLNWVPVVEAFRKEITMIPLVVVLTIIAVKDGLEDYTKYKLDKKINNLVTEVYCWEKNKYIEMFWKDVKVGDFIRLSCNEEIPADMVLLYSSDADAICHIETSSLDGETNLKERQVVKGYTEQTTELDPATYSGRIECEAPNNDLNSFRGFIENPNNERVGLSKDNLLMRGCKVRNTDVTIGIVVYAGHETKAMLNNTGSRYKRSKLERRVNRDIIWCVLLLFVMCSIGAIGHGLWLSRYPEPPPWSGGKWLSPPLGGFLMFWTMLILLQVLIPISLYVSIEFVKLGQIYFIQNDVELYDDLTDTRIQCGSLNVAEDLGQIQFIFSDKTGTLTENKMVFRRCSIAGKEYGHKEHAKRLETYQDHENEDEDVDLSPSQSTSRIRRKSSIFITGKSESHMFRRYSATGAPSLRQLAFSSPLETDVEPDLRLQSKFNRISSKAYEWTEMLVPMPEIMNISEFFIALTICNTVVVSQPNQPSLKRRWSSITKMLDFPLNKQILDKFTYCKPTQILVQSRSSEETKKTKNLEKSPKPNVIRVQFQTSLIDETPETSENSPSTLNQEELKSLSQPDFGKKGLPCEPIQLSYEAESPDEAALVHAARAYGCILKGRKPDQVTVDMGHLGTLEFDLLHVLPFDSTRKRMSVVVRHPILNKIVVYTKGADSVMMDLLAMELTGEVEKDLQRAKMKGRTQRHLDEYATKGLRTLCLAMKVLSKEEYNEWQHGHLLAECSIEDREQMLLESAQKLENNLILLGATGIEDRLQEGVPETIEALRKAGINIWMLTGDKQETAVNIACSCKLFDMTDEICTLKSDNLDDCEKQIDNFLEKASRNDCPQENLGLDDAQPNCALVIDGQTLEFALCDRVQEKFLKLTACVRAVICCRATPLQKSRVVSLVRKKLNAMTLAIGDGANDVSMIQVADIGIGISGQEGMQAVLASDFAISQFAQLKKLLFVHGHWCYTRLTNMILYFFYKNLTHVSLLFWYQFFCGFSGTAMVDYWSMIFFNLLYTSLPPIIFGILDKDMSAESLMSHPELYKTTQKYKQYWGLAFVLNLADAFYQSLVCFFIPYFTYVNSDMDVFSFGIPINTSMFFIINLHLIIESKSLNKIHFAVFGFSAVLFFGISGSFGATCINCNPPGNPYWMMQRHLVDPVFHLVCIITILVALLPRFMFRVIQNTIYPSPLMEIRFYEEQKLFDKEEISETACDVDSVDKYAKSLVAVV